MSVFAPFGGSDDHARVDEDVGYSSDDTLSEEEMNPLPRRAGASDGPCYDSHAGGLRGQRPNRNSSSASGAVPAAAAAEEVSLEKFMALTQQLQEEEDRREQDAKMAAAVREAEERNLRNRRWAEVKARMTARNSTTPGSLSIRSAEWGDAVEEDESFDDIHGRSGEGAGSSSVGVALVNDPLLEHDERPLTKLLRREKVPWLVSTGRSMYNWFRWGILAMFYMRDLAEDPSGYYQQRQFE